MPNVAGYTWPDSLDAIIREEAARAECPLDLAYTYIAAESGFHPDEHVDNDLEDSVGLLELNRRGGQGAGYSVEQLLDARTNLVIGLPHITAAFRAVWRPELPADEYIYQVSIRSGHPGQVDRGDERITRIFNLWQQFVAAYPPTSAPPISTPPPPADPAPPSDGQQLRALRAALVALFQDRTFAGLSADDRATLRYIASQL